MKQGVTIIQFKTWFAINASNLSYYRSLILCSKEIIPIPSDRLAPLVLLVFLLTIVTNLQARNDQPTPFSTTHISVEIGGRPGIGDLNEFWTAGLPASLSMAMPFYFGRVEAGAQILHFRTQHNRIPDFQTTYIFIGWGLRKSLISNLSIFGGLRLGNQLMTFARDDNYGTESELGTEASVGLAIKIPPKWTLQVTVRSQRIHTQVPLIFDFGSISISRRFITPAWLRGILE